MTNMFKVVKASAHAKADSFLRDRKKEEGFEKEVEMEKTEEREENEEEEDEDELEHTPPPMEKIGMESAEFTVSI